MANPVVKCIKAGKTAYVNGKNAPIDLGNGVVLAPKHVEVFRQGNRFKEYQHTAPQTIWAYFGVSSLAPEGAAYVNEWDTQEGRLDPHRTAVYTHKITI